MHETWRARAPRFWRRRPRERRATRGRRTHAADGGGGGGGGGAGARTASASPRRSDEDDGAVRAIGERSFDGASVKPARKQVSRPLPRRSARCSVSLPVRRRRRR